MRLPQSTITDSSHIALIIIDNQIGALENEYNYYGTSRSNPRYEDNIKALLTVFRDFNPDDKPPHVIHIYHQSSDMSSPLYHGKSTMAIHPSSAALPHEPIFSKTQSNAFSNPELIAYLKEKEISTIYFAGLSLDHCVSSTMRIANDLGIGDHEPAYTGRRVLLEDAVVAWAKTDGKYDAETIHGVHVESLRREFALVEKTEDVVNRFKKSKEHRDQLHRKEAALADNIKEEDTT